MFSETLLTELDTAQRQYLITHDWILSSSNEGYIRVRFTGNSITETHVTRVQKYIEATYNHETQLTHNGSLIIFNNKLCP
jgi:hypothetical protein